MKNLIFVILAAMVFVVGCGNAPAYEFGSQGKSGGSDSDALVVDGVFMEKATQTENTCFAGGLKEYSDLIPFTFTGDSEGEMVPGDAILLFEKNPIVEEGVTFDFHVPLRYAEEYGEWLGLIIWHPDDEIGRLQYSPSFSGEGGIADYHSASITIEYSPELCESGLAGSTTTHIEGWRVE